jgi:hypothetical protein
VDHQIDVLDTLKPRALLIANAFGSQSIGHFPSYKVKGHSLDPKSTSRAFSDELRSRGYNQVKMNVWNNRPTYWKREG